MEKVMKKRYLRNFAYHQVNVVNKIADIIKNKGGVIVTYRPFKKEEITIYEIYNREIEKMPKVETTYYGCFTTYIKFIYNGYVYYIEFPSNVFDDICVSKRECKNFVTTQRSYMTKLESSCEIMEQMCSEQEYNTSMYEDIAEKIISEIISMKMNLYVERKKVRVSNVYNTGYHYESVVVPFSEKFYAIE